MEQLRIKESLQNHPETSHLSASAHDPGSRTIPRAVVSFLSVSWHVILQCLRVESHPQSGEKLVAEGHMPSHDVLAAGMLCQEVRKQTRSDL